MLGTGGPISSHCDVIEIATREDHDSYLNVNDVATAVIATANLTSHGRLTNCLSTAVSKDLLMFLLSMTSLFLFRIC